LKGKGKKGKKGKKEKREKGKKEKGFWELKQWTRPSCA
jgi:hypothetical protein